MEGEILVGGRGIGQVHHLDCIEIESKEDSAHLCIEGGKSNCMEGRRIHLDCMEEHTTWNSEEIESKEETLLDEGRLLTLAGRAQDTAALAEPPKTRSLLQE